MLSFSRFGNQRLFGELTDTAPNHLATPCFCQALGEQCLESFMGLLPVPLCGKKSLKGILFECLALKGGKRFERLMLLLCDVDGQPAHDLGFVVEWLWDLHYHKCKFVGFANAQDRDNRAHRETQTKPAKPGQARY